MKMQARIVVWTFRKTAVLLKCGYVCSICARCWLFADQQESDGRRVLVLRRAAELKEPAINITISKGVRELPSLSATFHMA